MKIKNGLTDLHIHSLFSDGESSPREIVLSAIDKGIDVIGFSDHSYTEFDRRFCLKENGEEEYVREISSLKEEFKEKITVLCATERDYFSEITSQKYDYVIGSVHYIFEQGEYIPIDETPKILTDAAKRFFGGDMISLCCEYYDLLGGIYEKTHCDIVGHFDLITKFNEKYRLIDESDPRYTEACRNAIDRIIPKCKIFEVNTGAISRNWRTTPYPSKPIVDYIKEKGGQFILSSDSHKKDTLIFEFDKWREYVL